MTMDFLQENKSPVVISLENAPSVVDSCLLRPAGRTLLDDRVFCFFFLLPRQRLLQW